MTFSFEKLTVYQKTLNFSVSVIDTVDSLDTDRRHYRLIEQLESACTSIALNIAEGKGRHSKKEFKHFLYISRGSLFETVALLQIFNKKNWLSQERYNKFYEESETIHKMISGLINSI